MVCCTKCEKLLCYARKKEYNELYFRKGKVNSIPHKWDNWIIRDNDEKKIYLLYAFGFNGIGKYRLHTAGKVG